MVKNNEFDSIRIGLASPEKILEWSRGERGEVTKPETINYRTHKPEKGGLFCEAIFGPQKDWECSCGKYKRIKYRGIICDKCGVEVTKSQVRRERMGHIKLAAPVSHIWYFKGIPSKMGILLNMSPRDLEKVLYFSSYMVYDPGDTDLKEKQILDEREHFEYKKLYGDRFKAGMGAETVKKVLKNINLTKLSEELREVVENSTGQKKTKAIRRLDVVESFINSNNKPEWMILDVVPVIPPDLRPMVQLDGGRFAASDLNDLYRRVINRNKRLARLQEIKAPEIICRNEKRMLQEAVDSLIDNGRRGRSVKGPGNRDLKSLSDMLKGKHGRFRQNLLGKRVDYSGRSVIVVGPELKFYQCGLPKNMALELFKPFVVNRLGELKLANNMKSAKAMIDRLDPVVWDVVEEVIKDHPVLLNRAPTLHRLGIQAFEPVLIDGKAIRLHPLVCTAYNADFDGDQMAVHVPLSVEAQTEARFLMLSVNNILTPKDGSPITKPSQDMVLGAYYLTMDYEEENEREELKIYSDVDEMVMAYRNKVVTLHERVKVRVEAKDGSKALVESTVGRFIFNQKIPQELGFVDREKDPYSIEIDFECTKKKLEEIIARCYVRLGNTRTSEMLDDIKEIGFHYSTQGAISVSVSDMVVPEEKTDLIEEAREKVALIEKKYRRGLYKDEEKHQAIVDIWEKTTKDVTKALMKGLDKKNNINIMATSGARGTENQIRQLAGMRGLMSNTRGETVEIPIVSNFREGLSVLEYFISTTGARKGNADTALRTADSGYLTRRLVDVSQDIIVREDDCGTENYIEVKDIIDDKAVIVPLRDRIKGRHMAENIVHPETGEILAHKNMLVSEELAKEIEDAGIKSAKVRSVLSCEAKHGVCARCYGVNLANQKPVNVGESVGIIAAQSIGEPGTQLTMRTFHSGGVAGNDITQGLPRVEELFEARKPKGMALIAEIDGVVSFEHGEKKSEIVITGEDGHSVSEQIVYGSTLLVDEGQTVKAGDALTKGSLYPADILRIVGVKGVQEYITKEVQRVYRLQGENIADKHIEIIIKQMLSKVIVKEPNDSNFVPGSLISASEFKQVNEKLVEEGKEPATKTDVILGITKASLATDSFLSAASFQETTRVLTDAAIRGKEDNLVGLKENVIIGKLIPAGTGMKVYTSVDVKPTSGVNLRVGGIDDEESISEENTVEVLPEEVEAE